MEQKKQKKETEREENKQKSEDTRKEGNNQQANKGVTGFYRPVNQDGASVPSKVRQSSTKTLHPTQSQPPA